MCGIIGYVGPRPVVGVLVGSLKRLEYRGYDSSGVAFVTPGGIEVEKSSGRIDRLEALLARRTNGSVVDARLGIGHTRWATHGAVTQGNAHPHLSCRRDIVLVHNGIIENHRDLRRWLEARGHRFRSETDSEVVVHLIEEHLGRDERAAIARAMDDLVGSYALAVAFLRRPDVLFGVRRNSPLVAGFGERESFLASDIPAVLPFTRRVDPLGEEEIVEASAAGVSIFGAGLLPRAPRPMTVEWEPGAAEREGYAHYMLKEIHEQPRALERELADRIDARRGDVRLPEIGLTAARARRIERVVVAACGTAWHAALYGKAAIEELAGVPVEVGLSSEVRYGAAPWNPDTLFVAISQSGETADTLAAFRRAQEGKLATLGITNGRGSTLSREAGWTLPMRSGPEIGVAATKTYTAQLVDVLLFALWLGRRRGELAAGRAREILAALLDIPAHVKSTLACGEAVRAASDRYLRDFDYMYLGRTHNVPTALEGALKMKELSYRPAEGYAAGEMKHGPLARVDAHMAVLAVVAPGAVRDKMVGNLNEVRTRGGKVLSVGAAHDPEVAALSDETFPIPSMPEILTPIAAVVPLQLFAYHTAVGLGHDVDHPRNLAKSVTVE